MVAIGLYTSMLQHSHVPAAKQQKQLLYYIDRASQLAELNTLKGQKRLSNSSSASNKIL